jgi:SAM-dependent methyltransferase
MKQTISRFLPLSVKGRLRKTVDLFQYKIARFSRANRFLPPPFLTNVGNSDFIETGNEFFTYFVDLGQLKPSDKVLDVGCGSGRMARRLTEYLTTGSYDGIDITKDSIDWANKTYSGFPNFRFHFSDIFNKYYNPKGTVSAEEYRFPFDDAQFDFVFLTSVFTHMLERDVQNYLSEIRRVLRSGGCAFITCFLLNEFSLKQIAAKNSEIDFAFTLGDCLIRDTEYPESAIAYPEQKMLVFFADNFLKPGRVFHGKWSGRSDGLSFQDIIIARAI